MFARLSVVIPVYNERENLKDLTSRLQTTLENISVDSFEVLYIDDGSRDGSDAILDAISAADPRYKVLHFSRNFGHQAALQAGLDAATGDAVILMDADLQDPPEVLSKLVGTWRQGFDVVYAIRKGRKEALWKRLCYQLFYRSLRFIAEIDAPMDAGDFCLMDRRVVDTLVSLREQKRFLRGLRSWVGFRQIGVEYEREARNAGVPKYTLRKLIRLAVSGYVGFSSLPLRIAAWLGLGAAIAGFFVSLWVIVSRLAYPSVPQGWASTTAVVLLIGGVQLMVLGVMGEYLSRVYDEVRRRPLYIIRSQMGFPHPLGTLRSPDRGQPGVE